MLKKGFTMVELLTVVAILSLLSGIAVYAYNNYTLNAKVSAARATLDSLIIRDVALYLSNGEFSSSVADFGLTAGSAANTTAIPVTVNNYLDPYLARVTVTASAAATGSCAYGVVKGYVAGLKVDEYRSGGGGTATNNYLDLQYIAIDVNGKIQTLCYFALGTGYDDIHVSGCSLMTFGESPETQPDAADFISQCP